MSRTTTAESQATATEPRGGQGLMHERHRTFCGTLDRLLTVGSYYQPRHERFQTMATAVQGALLKSSAGFDFLVIHVRDQGLVIHEGFLDSEAAEARRLHQLLAPLGIVRLEIDAGADGHQIHQAFSVFKQAHGQSGQDGRPGPIDVDDLPETIRVFEDGDDQPEEAAETEETNEDTTAPPTPSPLPAPEPNTLAGKLQAWAEHPDDSAFPSVEEALAGLHHSPDPAGAPSAGLLAALKTVLSWDEEDRRLRIWPVIWDNLPSDFSRDPEALWHELWTGLSSDQRRRAWPYLVNDLLQGLPVRNRLTRHALLDGLSQVPALQHPELRTTLENLSALQTRQVAEGFFDAPPPLLYPVHMVLIGCSVSGRFGPLLHDHLVRQSPHPLAAVMLDIMDRYQPVNRGVYQAILHQGIAETPTPEMAELAPDILLEALSDLHWDFMEEEWVVPAITWLGRLGGPTALPLLSEIIDEKKYLVLNSWPRQARLAAEQARRQLKTRLRYRGAQHAVKNQ